jgi:hypothetical protein
MPWQLRPRPLEPLERENNDLKTTIVVLRREVEIKEGHVGRLQFLHRPLKGPKQKARPGKRTPGRDGAVVVKGAKTRKQRLLRRVVKQDGPDGCWIWTGARSKNGQGAIHVAGKLYAVHRLAHQLWLGPIPPGHRVKHRCGNLACCNPRHLYLASLEERLLDKIEKQRNGCWLWRGGINKKGYGRIKLSQHRYRAVHRVAYELWLEPIPEGLQVLHVCGNSTCCNPDHLAVVAVSENAALRTRLDAEAERLAEMVRLS